MGVMFLRAQERFNAGQAFGVRRNGYAAEIMKQYGNGGEKWSLPNRDDKGFERAFEHYKQERQHTTGLQERLASHEAEMQALRSELDLTHRHRNMLVDFVNHNFQTSDTAHVDRGGDNGGGDDLAGGGDSVLPALQTDAHDGPPEAVNSSNVTKSADGRNRRRGSSRNNDAKRELVDHAADEGPRDAGGSSSEPPDATDAVVGGQADEHDAEE